MLSRTCAACFLAVAVHASAQSLPAPPSGWTSQTVDTAIVLKSPAPGPQIAVTLLPRFHAQGEIKTWFANQVLAIARFAGNILNATDVTQ